MVPGVVAETALGAPLEAAAIAGEQMLYLEGEVAAHLFAAKQARLKVVTVTLDVRIRLDMEKTHSLATEQ